MSPVYFSGFLLWGCHGQVGGTRFQVGMTTADQSMYGLECCNLRSADLHSLDFTYNRLFMKLFRTKSIDVWSKIVSIFSVLFSRAFLSKADKLACQCLENAFCTYCRSRVSLLLCWLIWICFIYCLFSWCIRFVIFIYHLVNKVDQYPIYIILRKISSISSV